MDEMVRYYSCKRQTKRWPMVLWYNMLNVAVMNAYTLFKGVHPEYMNGVNHKRRLFLKRAGKRACHASHDMASETTRAQEARQRGNDKVRVGFFTHDPTSKCMPAAKTKEVSSLPYCKSPQS